MVNINSGYFISAAISIICVFFRAIPFPGYTFKILVKGMFMQNIEKAKWGVHHALAHTHTQISFTDLSDLC